MTIANWIGQIWPFAHEMKISDLVIMPLKKQWAFQIGEITGDYHFEKKDQALTFIGDRLIGFPKLFPEQISVKICYLR